MDLRRLHKRTFPIGIGLLVTLIFVLYAARIIDLNFMDRLEALSYDLRLNLTLPHSHNSKIVIVDIDEKSLSEEGRWPWGRNKLALLVENLFRHNASVVGFDVVFAEKDDSSGLRTLEQLGREGLHGDEAFRNVLANIRGSLDYDGVFARLIKDKPVVLGYYFTNYAEKSRERVSGQLPPGVFPAATFAGMNIPFVKMTGYGANLPELQQNAMNSGHFNQLPDADGVVRRVPMIIEYNGSYYESLSLAVVRALFGNPALKPGLVSAGTGGSAYKRIEWLQTSDIRIPVDEHVTSLIPYAGGQGSFPYLSASDVLRNRIKTDVLEGAIVLIGTTSPGLMDLRSTPVQAVYPGVEVHANMITGILDQTIKQKPAYAMGAELLVLLVSGLLLSFLLPFLSPLKSAWVSLLVLACAAGVNIWAWKGNMVLPLASSALMIPLISVLNMSYGFFIEARAKRQITGLFGQYVPPKLVYEMSRNPGNFTMEGESRDLTVLFSDVRNFTSISESLSPKELSKMMNEYMTAMTAVVQKHRGTIDKYIGDAIMAFWGAPLGDPEHARNAVLAAMEMQQTLAAMRPQFAERGWPELHIGVGLNTGMMRVGNMGSQFRIAYTVMGDAVNLASRLEGVTKNLGVGIIAGEGTRNAVSDAVFRELDMIRVKGKKQPVAIYEPLGMNGQVEKAMLAEVSLFEQGLRHYRAMEWEAAERILAELQELSKYKHFYQMFRERIAGFLIDPPHEDWDGVYDFKTK